MTVTFTPADPGGVPVILGLTGPSRSGKTYSALRIALGMTSDPAHVFMIDTERGRSSMYVPKFGQFKQYCLEPPYSYARYSEAIAAAVDADSARVIIVDSLSHGHDGEGGMIDQHEAEIKRMAGADGAKRERVKMAAWIKPKRELGHFVQSVMRVEVPMIFCFRAKERLRIVPGKPPESLGFRPICSDELTFEMTSMLDLPENARGVPSLSAPATSFREPFDSFVKEGAVLDEALGERIAEWSRGSNEKPTEESIEPSPSERMTQSLEARLREATDQNALKAIWSEFNQHKRAMTDTQIKRIIALKDDRQGEMK